MEKNYLKAPLKEVTEEEEFLIEQLYEEKGSSSMTNKIFQINEDSEPKLVKAKSKYDSLMNDYNQEMNFSVSRNSSKSVNYKIFMNKLAINNGEGMRESIIQKNEDILDGVRRFYSYSGEPSNQAASSQRFGDNLEVPDLEFNRNSGETQNEEQAAVNLYIINLLCEQMGFSRTMVKNILIYDKDLIGNDIQKTIEYGLKTEEGWKHTFIPEEKDRLYHAPENYESESDISFESRGERCLICGEGEEEHKKLTARPPNSVRQISESETSTHLMDDEDIHYGAYYESNQQNQIREDSDPESEEEPDDPDEETIECLIGYDRHTLSKSYSLSCGHQFGLKCLRMMFKVGIHDGKVLETNGAHYDGDRKYTENDVRKIVKNKKLLEKFERFRTNIEVNKDKNKQWCPHPNGGEWVKGSAWKSKVECENGHQFCFICQQDWHKGNGKDALDEKLLDYVSEKGICRCPKGNIRTEK